MFAVLHNQPIQSDNDSIFNFYYIFSWIHSHHNYSTKDKMVLHAVMCVYLVDMNINLVYQTAGHKKLFAIILLIQIALPLKTLSTE